MRRLKSGTDGFSAQSKEIANGLDIMNYRGKAVFEFLHNKNLLDVIESLVGTEIICNPIQHLRPTPPIRYYEDSNPASHIGPLHQDAGVIMPEAEGSDIITCWLPLGDATAEMGCLEVFARRGQGRIFAASTRRWNNYCPQSSTSG